MIQQTNSKKTNLYGKYQFSIVLDRHKIQGLSSLDIPNFAICDFSLF